MLAVLLTFCLGCTTKEVPAAPLMVNAASVDFGGLGGEQKIISVTSGTDWYARSSDNWVRILSASGDGGDQATKCRISVADNFTGESRKGKISFSNLSGDKVEVAVNQVSAPDPHVVRGISTAADLLGFAQAVNNEGSVAQYLVDGVVKFNNDIDCSSITEWVPIGSQEIPMIYDIDGNNKVLKNVHWTIDVSQYPTAGFIGVADNVKIRRLTLGVKGTDKIVFSGNPTGKVRAGGIIGRAQSVVLEKVTNAAALEVKGTSATGNNLILGGLVGYSDSSCLVGGELVSTKGCRSLGDITVPVVSQSGGLVGYNSGIIQNCTFNATLTCPSDGTYGPGWICSHCQSVMANITGNIGMGFVGNTPSMMRNSMMNYREGYNPEDNTVDWTLDAYYDWTAVETRQLHQGATYYHYSCTNVPREIYVVEVDLTNPGIELAAAWAGDKDRGEMIPNPNGNANNNNGFNLRERLSDVCKRQRSEGKKILAGVNASFFDSNNGIGRGFYVEDGQPLYINNPSVVKSLTNHVWAFTVFTDGTASCGKKTFSGKIKVGSAEYDFSSVNDTTLRHAHADCQVNLFTSHYVRVPYASKPNIISDLAKNVLYVICQWDGDPMKVNTGYASATVKEIKDGRTTPLSVSALPYFTQKNRIGIALSGETAEAVKASLQVGSKVQFKCDMAVDGLSKPIRTQVSTMFQMMNAGQDASNTIPASHTIRTTYDPKTFTVVSADLKKVWLVQVDGREMWYSLGVKAYEMYRIGKKLGGAWVTGLDGGGSAAMWVWNPSKSSGAIVGRPSDSKGERSCMNYLIVKEK